jgi:hypothetical protein
MRIFARDVLTPVQLASIGAIAVESAHLENIVDTTIVLLTKLKVEEISKISPSAMLASKLDTLRDIGLPELPSKTCRPQFSELVGQCKHLNW